MAKVELAIIGGSGFYEPGLFTDAREESVPTPYGKVEFIIGKLGETELAFLPRHGKEHSVLPHQLNYRANIRGLKELGVNRVITTTAVGSMNERFTPGSLVLIDQFMDFTKQRAVTFYESGDAHQAHIDMTEPFCPEIRSSLMAAAQKNGINVFEGGCYVCTEGPRFETPAEIRAFKMLGGDVAGMTAVPEVVLARELGICYANISIITNWAAGINSQRLSHSEVVEVMHENQAKLRLLIKEGLLAIPKKRSCCCGGR